MNAIVQSSNNSNLSPPSTNISPENASNSNRFNFNSDYVDNVNNNSFDSMQPLVQTVAGPFMSGNQPLSPKSSGRTCSFYFILTI